MTQPTTFNPTTIELAHQIMTVEHLTKLFHSQEIVKSIDEEKIFYHDFEHLINHNITHSSYRGNIIDRIPTNNSDIRRQFNIDDNYFGSLQNRYTYKSIPSLFYAIVQSLEDISNVKLPKSSTMKIYIQSKKGALSPSNKATLLYNKIIGETLTFLYNSTYRHRYESFYLIRSQSYDTVTLVKSPHYFTLNLNIRIVYKEFNELLNELGELYPDKNSCYTAAKTFVTIQYARNVNRKLNELFNYTLDEMPVSDLPCYDLTQLRFITDKYGPIAFSNYFQPLVHLLVNNKPQADAPCIPLVNPCKYIQFDKDTDAIQLFSNYRLDNSDKVTNSIKVNYKNYFNVVLPISLPIGDILKLNRPITDLMREVLCP